MLPSILKLTADNMAFREAYDHHIDWEALTPA